MANSYDIGDTVRVTATFTDTGGTLVDPAKVTFLVGSPTVTSTETSTGSNVINPSSGVYYLDVVIDTAGAWNYRVLSTGVVDTAADDYFRVLHPRVSS